MAEMDYNGYRDAQEAKFIAKEIARVGSDARTEFELGFTQVRDTGWRKVVNNSGIANNPNLNAYLRRVGNTVYFNILEHTSGAVATATVAVYVLPSGFRLVQDSLPAIYHNTVVDSGASSVANSTLYIASGGTFTLNLKAIINVRHYSNLSFPTQDAWPAVLPGTAV